MFCTRTRIRDTRNAYNDLSKKPRGRRSEDQQTVLGWVSDRFAMTVGGGWNGVNSCPTAGFDIRGIQPLDSCTRYM